MSTYTTAINAMVELVGIINPDIPYGIIRMDCTRALDDAVTGIRLKYCADEGNRNALAAVSINGDNANRGDK